MWNFPLLPDRASTVAGRVDALYYFLTAVAVFFTLIIVIGLVTSAIRYRKGSKASRAGSRNDNLPLELAWTLIPLVIALVIFGWSSKLFVDMRVAPANAMEIYVVAKQWMWKIQHPQGNQEINELHVPVGRPVKLVMTSQDVIHSFFVPEFRIKQDVLPGRYTTEWFQATKTGTFHLFCAEYCGTGHSAMIGKVVVMEPGAYEQWLAGKGGMSMAAGGEQLFQRFGCETCHRPGAGQRGPTLDGLWGKQVKLATGAVVTADQGYIKESILDPSAKVVSGYRVLMPLYRAQMTEDQVNELVEYIRTLGNNGGKQ